MPKKKTEATATPEVAFKPDRSGKGGKRTPRALRPKCAYCGGTRHFNMSATAVNAECLMRQFALATGLITDPLGNVPKMSLERMEDIVIWSRSLKHKPLYGTMVSENGEAGTYAAAARPPKKEKAAPVEAAPKPTKGKSKLALVPEPKQKRPTRVTPARVEEVVERIEDILLMPETNGAADKPNLADMSRTERRAFREAHRAKRQSERTAH